MSVQRKQDDSCFPAFGKQILSTDFRTKMAVILQHRRKGVVQL